MNILLLNLLVFVPLAAVAVIYLSGISGKKEGMAVGFVASFFSAGISLYFLLSISPSGEWYIYFEKEWIEALGIGYRVGLNSLSLPLTVLSNILFVLTYYYMAFVEKKPFRQCAFFLVMQTAVNGVFAANDLFLFYLFWEISLIPMFFVIYCWGGENRERAGIKFLLYTHAASLAMLLGILTWVYSVASSAGRLTFSLSELIAVGVPEETQTVMFFLLVIGFLVKLPSFPFHTWLPEAHVEAPTAGSMILAGIMLKMGGYGLVRILIPAVPLAVSKFGFWLAALGTFSIFYGAVMALQQDDLKKMVAYSSVSHMGFVLAGLFIFNPEGYRGAVYQMVAHGFISAMLFLFCGEVKHIFGSRKISGLGGISTSLPVFGFFGAFSFMASLGLPGLAGFIAEFQVISGMVKYDIMLSAVILLALLLTAFYYLAALEKAFYGPTVFPDRDFSLVPELRNLLVVFSLIIFTAGIFPGIFLDHFSAAFTEISMLGGM